jgi:hypothetical protein
VRRHRTQQIKIVPAVKLAGRLPKDFPGSEDFGAAQWISAEFRNCCFDLFETVPDTGRQRFGDFRSIAIEIEGFVSTKPDFRKTLEQPMFFCDRFDKSENVIELFEETSIELSAFAPHRKIDGRCPRRR